MRDFGVAQGRDTLSFSYPRSAIMSSAINADEKDTGTSQSPLPRPTGRNANAGGGADADVEDFAEPDADADRDAPTPQVAPGEGDPRTDKPPLEIKQIEDLEDDAKGG
jgi:hypothetical protein